MPALTPSGEDVVKCYGNKGEHEVEQTMHVRIGRLSFLTPRGQVSRALASCDAKASRERCVMCFANSSPRAMSSLHISFSPPHRSGGDLIGHDQRTFARVCLVSLHLSVDFPPIVARPDDPATLRAHWDMAAARP